MHTRITKWRHKTGRSKKYIPKGQPDYFRVAYAIGSRYFSHLPGEERRQECHLLTNEALKKKRIFVDRFAPRSVSEVVGNGRDCMGIKAFSRATYRRFYSLSLYLGFFRPKNSKAYLPRHCFYSDYKLEKLVFEAPIDLLIQIKKLVSQEIYDRAIASDKDAIAFIKEAIWK